MTENMQASRTQSRRAVIVRCCLKLFPCAVFAAFLCSCSNPSEIIAEGYVMAPYANECFYESEAFDCVSNGSKFLITYYSAAADKCVPVCTKPNCTHISDDCTAVVNGAKGMLKAEDELIFFDYGKSGEGILLKSDFNGSNRKQIAAIDNLISYNWIDAVYSNDKVLCIYQDTVGFEEAEEDEPLEMTDEYINRIDCIDINSGEVTNVLYKKNHAASVLNALIYDGKLIYSYQSFTRDIRNLPEDKKPGDYYISGFYSLDLSTGEEKKLSEGYDKMLMAEQSFNYFNPERIICYNLDDHMLYLYNMNTGEFSPVSECAGVYNYFIADNDEMFYFMNKDDTQYTRYCFETGEISYVPMLPKDYLPICIVGNTVWLAFNDEQGRYCRGWVDRDEFVSGKHNNIRFAYYVNSLDGSVSY